MARPPQPISFGKGSDVGRTGQEGIAEFTNAYLHRRGEAGKAPFVAYASNGLTEFATLGSDPNDFVRAMLDLDTELLTVAGRRLFVSNAAGGPAVLAGGIPADGIVTMAANRKFPDRQVAIVCDGFYFIYENGTVVQGADPDLPPPVAVIEKGGFLIFLIGDGRVFFTAVNDITVDALDLIEANVNADGLVMGTVRGPDAIFAGPKSLEFWQLGGGEVPFSRGHSIDMGCYAAGSMQKITALVNEKLVDSVIWAATDHKGQFAGVYLLDGFTPLKVSTDEVDRLVEGEADARNIRSAAWTEDAHTFYSISGSGWTRVYDSSIAPGEWHTRRSFGRDKWRCGAHAYFAKMTIFGDHATNKLYVSKRTVLDEVGDPIIWKIVTPPIHMWPQKFQVNAVHLDVLTGVGVNSEDPEQANPILFFDYTRDGGLAWAAQRQLRLGGQSQRWVRVPPIRALGRFDHNGFSLRLSAYASVVKGIQGSAIEAVPLR
jgi:hypothetical protein